MASEQQFTEFKSKADARILALEEDKKAVTAALETQIDELHLYISQLESEKQESTSKSVLKDDTLAKIKAENQSLKDLVQKYQNMSKASALQ